MRLIGISGLAGSGKDTVAKALVELADFARVSLADPMKEFCEEVFGFTEEQLWGGSEHRNAIDERYGISPREALQKLGTEWGRALYADVWINVAIDRAKVELDNPFAKVEGIVIPDVRWPNEARRIREEGGQVWRVIRPGLAKLDGAAGVHASENALTDTDVYERMLVNDCGLGELEEMVLQAARRAA